MGESFGYLKSLALAGAMFFIGFENPTSFKGVSCLVVGVILVLANVFLAVANSQKAKKEDLD